MTTGYEVRLADFSGPLDLLLHLVRHAEMNIEDIRLAEVTDQYLEYMDQVGEVDMDRASDFLETASILVLIKSRSLLPAAVPENAAEDAPDPEQELLERMRLYAVFQSAAEPLRRQAAAGSKYFCKLPEDLIREEAEVRLSNADAQTLRATLAALLKRRPKSPAPEPVHHVAPEVYSVRRQKERLLLRLEQGPFLFSDLFDPASPRLEIVVTFMALLELWALGDLELEQSRPYAAITVLPGGTA